MGESNGPSTRGSSPSLASLGSASALRKSDPPPDHRPFQREGLIEPREGAARTRSGTRELQKAGEAGQCVLDEITRRLADYGSEREKHERWMRQTLSLLDAATINNLRYRLFAPHYDEHMGEHERAIDFLLRQFVDVERTAFPGRQPLIQDRVLEMSCGTGAVIKLMCGALGAERAAGMHFTANDLSPDMQGLARAKLHSLPASVDFTSQDISRLDFPSKSFGTIVLSQTLHLITDEDVIAQERASNYMHVDSERHIEAKYNVMTDAWDLLAPGGTFLIIDEWPALLTDRGGPLGPGFAYLFNDGLRSIDIDVFQSLIMQQMSGSKFVAQLKVPIDSKHHMHLLAYRKDEPKPHSRIPLTPDFGPHRETAAARVLETFRAIDGTFIDSLNPSGGGNPWVSLHPIPEDSMIIRPGHELEPEAQRHSSIVLDRCLHDLDHFDRYDLISSAVRSLAVGGSLIIIDEWNPPEGKRNPLRLSSLGSSIMMRFTKNMIFAGSMRLPIHDLYNSGMYGFEYRKVI